MSPKPYSDCYIVKTAEDNHQLNNNQLNKEKGSTKEPFSILIINQN